MPRLATLLLTLTLAACAGTEVATAPSLSTPEPVAAAPDTTVAPAPAVAPGSVAPMLMSPDTAQAGRFDAGRMFTFDNPPRAYLAETYGFTPDDAWFERARLGALRFADYCSASFVSPDGLILTNHHCARQSVTAVTEGTEALHDESFYAATPGAERPVEDLYVEQLVAMEDVTDEVEAAGAGMETDAERIDARNEAITAIEERIAAEAGGEEDNVNVEVISFYNGAQYAAYTFRRYDDIRLVFAPEHQLGHFGGELDNFTYPRYSLDFAFLRAYGGDGAPLDTDAVYFPWSLDGTAPGDLVFVVGNPGSTTRLQTVAQLEYRRDVEEPAVLRLYATRADAYEAFLEAHPDDPAAPEARDTYLSLLNSEKAFTGHVEGLRDPYLLARRAAAERDFRFAVAGDPELQAAYGTVFDDLAANRQELRAFADDFGAFAAMNPGSPIASNTLTRAVYAYAYALSNYENFRDIVLEVEDRPQALEAQLLEARLEDFVHYFGIESPLVRQIFQGRTPDVVARDLLQTSAFATASGTAEALGGNLAASNDPALNIVALLWPRFVPYQQQAGALATQAEELAGRLARVRFQVYGTEIPPDATFSPRINDGVVRGYPYNGTVAPPYTTFYGLYDRHFSHADASHAELFALPDRWLPIPDDLDLDTPFNLVTTNDTVGGSSGSPLLNRTLEIVGVAFDSNIDGLPGDYIYLPEKNRSISMDARGILEVLRSVYDAERLVEELMSSARVPR